MATDVPMRRLAAEIINSIPESDIRGKFNIQDTTDLNERLLSLNN